MLVDIGAATETWGVKLNSAFCIHLLMYDVFYYKSSVSESDECLINLLAVCHLYWWSKKTDQGCCCSLLYVEVNVLVPEIGPTFRVAGLYDCLTNSGYNFIGNICFEVDNF